MDCLPKLGKRKKKEAEQGTQWTTLVITGGCETIALVQSCPLPGQTNLLDNTTGSALSTNSGRQER